MARLIDADNITAEELEKWFGQPIDEWYKTRFIAMINNQPTAEPQKVRGDGCKHCNSVFNRIIPTLHGQVVRRKNFCDNCGQDLRKGSE